jgi:hypothetical protein
MIMNSKEKPDCKVVGPEYLSTELSDKELQKLLENAMKVHAKALKEMPDDGYAAYYDELAEGEETTAGFIKPHSKTNQHSHDDLKIRVEELEQKVRQLSNFNEELIKSVKEMLTYYVNHGRIDISPLIKLGE